MGTNFTVKVDSTAKGLPETVRVIAKGLCIFDFSWQYGHEVCNALRDAIRLKKTTEARAGTDFVKFIVNEVPDVKPFSVVAGTTFKVGWLKNGNLMFQVGMGDAHRMWQAIKQATLKAEEIAKHEQVSYDAAILDRSGAPIGIAMDPRIREEARKLSTGDRRIRTSMKNGIRSSEVLPPPTISMVPLTPEQKLNRMSQQSKQRLLEQLKADPDIKGKNQ